MQQTNENVFRMWDTVITYLNSQELVWQNWAPFSRAVRKLKDFREAAKAQGVQQQSQSSVPETIGKNDLLDRMIAQAVLLAGNTHAFANETKDMKLASATDLTYSYFMQRKGTERADAVESLLEIVTPHLAQLGEYLVTSDTLDALRNLMLAYGESIGKLGAAIAAHKTATEDAGDIRREGQQFLKSTLDKLVRNFKESNANFVSDYRNARVVRDNSAGGSSKPPQTPTH